MRRFGPRCSYYTVSSTVFIIILCEGYFADEICGNVVPQYMMYTEQLVIIVTGQMSDQLDA